MFANTNKRNVLKHSGHHHSSVIFLYTLFAFLLSLFLSVFSLATYASPTYFPGLIPLEESSNLATDLLYHGKEISAAELNQLSTKQGKSLDLSMLSPKESGLWHRSIAPILSPLQRQEEDEFYVRSGDMSSTSNDHEVVQYNAQVESRSGTFRFAVSLGNNLNIVLIANKSVHNILLRKELLQKLGYTIPPTRLIKKIVVKFSSPLEKEVFFSQLAQQTFGDPSRWIIDYEQHLKKEQSHKEQDGPLSDSSEITMQDLVATQGSSSLYNLSMGFVPSAIINGRRVLNALLVPFAFVNIPESVNMFDWEIGRIIDDQIRLVADEAQEFTPSYFDAKWIARKIVELSRMEIEEIVAGAQYPDEVAALVTEKLIARKNQLAKLFKIEALEIPFYADISIPPNLIKGKIVKENWNGHASRYAFGDPESPFSKNEFGYLLGSRLLSNVIENAITYFNLALPRIDLNAAILNHNNDLLATALVNSITSGQTVKIPLGVWVYPTFGLSTIVSRDMVFGSYLGTNNTIQLADTIGVSMQAGYYLQIDGMGVAPLLVSSSGNGRYVRSFSHIRPLHGFKAALKYPFQNIMVPMLAKKYGSFFDDVLSPTFNNLPEEEKAKKIKDALTLFKSTLQVGESLIVTDSLSADLNLAAGVSYFRLVKALGQVSGSDTMLSRLHVTRPDENTIHIYKDKGNVAGLTFAINLQAAVPVIVISVKVDKGYTSLKYYQLNINENREENPRLLEALAAIRGVLLHNSLEILNNFYKPYTLTHSYMDSLVQGQILFFGLGHFYTDTDIEITHPSGSKRRFIRNVQALRKSIDFETFLTNSINSLFTDFTDLDVHLRNATNGNPGNTISGVAYNMRISLEGEVVKNEGRDVVEKNTENEGSENNKVSEGNREELSGIFGKILLTWRGWSLTAAATTKILKSINKRFQTDLYQESALVQTSKLLLYRIFANVNLYEGGIKNMTDHLSESEIRNIYGKHASGFFPTANALFFIHKLNRYHRNAARHNVHASLDTVRDMIGYANYSLEFKGLVSLMGGLENVYVTSKVEGFRQGDEKGEEPLYSSSLGEIGSDKESGPLQAMIEFTHMTESEFFAFWLQNPFN